jgi:hypothetical protein
MPELAQRIRLAVAQSKKVEREARILKQMLGGIQDLQSDGHKEKQNGNSKTSS